MTTGSWNRSQPIFTPYGNVGTVVYTRNWSGGDRPKVVYPPAPVEPFRVVRRKRDGTSETITIYRRVRTFRGDDRPPKRARDVDHPYTMSETYNSEELVTFDSFGSWSTGKAYQLFGEGNWGPANLLTANDQIKLVNKLAEKIKGSDFNLSVLLGEGHQTLRMIGDNAVKIAKAGYFTRKGDFSGAFRSLFGDTGRKVLKPSPKRFPAWSKGVASSVSARWLELQYGWLPLLGDIDSGAAMLAHQLNTPLQQTYRSSVRREVNRERFQTFGTNTASGKSTQQHRRSLIARITEDPNGLPQLSGILDPELVAWELLPFSFVADWFVPIGDWLSARASVSRLKGTFITSDLMSGRGYAPVIKVIQGPKPRCTCSGVSFSRTISSSLKVPMPTFKGIGKAASWQHCTNALALVTQVFTGGSLKGVR